MAIVSTAEAPKPPVIIVAAPYAPAGPIIAGTSSSENDVATGGLYSFEMDQTGLGFVAGMRARATVQTDPTTWIEGIIVTYNIPTNTVIINSDLSNGYGIYDGWNINVAGQPGKTGPKGDTGNPGPPGPMTGASLDSPAFINNPTAPTALEGDNDLTLANTAFVTRAVATAKVSPALTGTPTAPTAPLATHTIQIATTQFVQNALDNLGIVSGFAPLASPTFTGDPKVPTAAPGDADTSAASTAFVSDAVATAVTALKGGASTAGDTLGELEAITNANVAAIAAKANVASPAFTGAPTLTTPIPPADNSTALATTAFVRSVVVSTPGGGNVASVGTPVTGTLAVWTTPNTIEGRTPVSAGVAPLASPVFTGTPTAPTPTPATLSDQTVATAAFVQAAIAAALASGGFSTGDVKFTLKAVADPGWLIMDDGTIGKGTSSATTHNDACLNLYTLMWNNISNTNAPVLPGGRGVSAAADWAANKTIGLTKVLGRTLAAAGSGSGLTARTLGSFVGSETHVWNANELIAHTHNARVDGYHVVIQNTSQAYVAFDGGSNYNAVLWGGVIPAGSNSWVTTTAGSSTAPNIMNPTTYLNVMIKL